MKLRPSLFVVFWALGLAACSSDVEQPDVVFEAPVTKTAYNAELSGVADENIVALMRDALEIYRREADGAPSVAFLRRRAQGDVALALKIMRSFGYFEATAEVDVDGPAEGAEDQRAVARIIVTPGPEYTLKEHRFILTEPGAGTAPEPIVATSTGSPVGKAARAAGILRAEQTAVADLRDAGRIYAKRLGRDAVADPETDTILVETVIATGAQYRYGPTTFEGAPNVTTRYLETYIPWQEGEVVDLAQLAAVQRDLIRTELFNVGSAKTPADPPEGNIAPIVVTLEEAPPRTISGGVRYNTDIGPAVRGGFEHRNLFGENETITIEALVGLEEQSLDTRYRVPQIGRSGQDFVVGFDLRHIQDDAFDEIGGTLAAGIEREISPQLTVGAGALLELSQIEDAKGESISQLFGVPLFATFDDTNDRLDPSQGLRLRAGVTPFGGRIDETPVTFMIADATASSYLKLSTDGAYVLAGRARLGSIIAGDLDVVSANRRLFSGGGGSVRGYRERFIGPLDANNDPTGGLSAAEAGLELRARMSTVIGVAGFVEAGTVSEEVFPAFDEGVQIAVGGGVRYFSPIGPLRFDVGVPLNPRDADDLFQVYISIGQAF
ncbi:MAG: autotransporter assembly complex protein TamA [Pikeienuella sp.]